MRLDKPDPKAEWSQLVSSENLAPLALVCFGVWLHAADELMVATMTPAIVKDIGGTRLISWSLALYEIGSIIAGAVSALLVVRHGLRSMMAISASIYMVGCLVSALAPQMSVLLVGRLAQGIGGGGMVALSFVAIGHLFPRALMPLVLAAVSTLWGVSAFLGPLVGGIFAEIGFWRGGFGFFAAQACLLALWIVFGLPSIAALPATTGSGGFPFRRLGLLFAAVVLVASAGINVSPLRSTVLFLSGISLLVWFFRLDGQQSESRLLPRQTFDLRTGIGSGLLMVFCFSFATVALGIYGPLLIILIYSISPISAGYTIAMLSIGWSTMAVVVSKAPERLDGVMITVGMLLLTASIAGFAIAIPYGPFWLIIVCALLQGAGFGMAWTFILRRLTAVAPTDETERVASALPTVQRMGYAFGAAFIGIVANTSGIGDGLDLQTAREAGFWIFAACCPFAIAGLYSNRFFVRQH